jgi:hypothetical protein
MIFNIWHFSVHNFSSHIKPPVQFFPDEGMGSSVPCRSRRQTRYRLHKGYHFSSDNGSEYRAMTYSIHSPLGSPNLAAFNMGTGNHFTTVILGNRRRKN